MAASVSSAPLEVVRNAPGTPTLHGVPEDVRAAIFETLEHTRASFKRKLQDVQDDLHDTKSRMRRIESTPADCLLFEQSAGARQPYILFLIDGDNTLFRDEFLTKGRNGAQEAALSLAREIDAFIDKCQKLHKSWKPIVRIYSNLQGLARAFERAGTCAFDALQTFTRAFNKQRPFFEYIDAGDDKNAVDVKIKANFELYWSSNDCKHVVLGVSGHRGYVAFLRQFVPSQGESPRLTLLRALPFSQDFASLSRNFPLVEFSVFRQQRLGLNSPVSGPDQSITPDNLASDPHTTSGSEKALPSKQDVLTVSYNSRSQRIDAVLEHPNKLSTSEWRTLRLCNRFYLSKCCEPDCPRSHAAVLDQDDLRALARFARRIPCRTMFCSDPTCVSGHHCPYGEDCTRKSICRYGKTAHSVDTTIARQEVFDRATLERIAA